MDKLKAIARHKGFIATLAMLIGMAVPQVSPPVQAVVVQVVCAAIQCV